MPIKLKSIKAEAEACRKAWKGLEVGTDSVHNHHEVLTEKLTSSATDRINYILTDKPLPEQALRLRLFRPVTRQAWAKYQKVTRQAWAKYQKVTGPAWAKYQKVTGPAWAKYQKVTGPARAEYQKVTGQARAEYQKVTRQAHNIICKEKNCPWDGKTIF